MEWLKRFGRRRGPGVREGGQGWELKSETWLQFVSGWRSDARSGGSGRLTRIKKKDRIGGGGCKGRGTVKYCTKVVASVFGNLGLLPAV